MKDQALGYSQLNPLPEKTAIRPVLYLLLDAKPGLFDELEMNRIPEFHRSTAI